MAMGIPIISNKGIGDSDSIIEYSESGKLVSNFTDKEYNIIIDQIDVLLETDSSKIREASKHNFSLEKGVEDYHSVYQTLIH